MAEEMKEIYKDFFVPCVADVRDPVLLTKKLSNILQAVGNVTHVVTAAGYVQFGTLEDLSNKQIRDQFQTNVEGTLNVIRPLLPTLRRSNSPRILLVSSMSGVACWPLLGAYQISKFAIEAISDTLRQELHNFGIQVGCIEPGPHKTGWATKYAHRTEISESYDQNDLLARVSCGYTIQDPKASLPFFWKMFDSPIMPRRITTSPEFVDFVIKETQEKIRDWRTIYG
jgi:NADP-dependent 3-hydroxy acid dehydrogenase YdfG